MDVDDERIIQDSSHIKDVKRRRTLKIIGVCGLLFAMMLAVGGVTSYLTLKTAAKDGTELAQQIQKECELPGLTDPDLAKFCPKADEIVEAAPEQVKADPVPGPEGPAGPQGTQGEPGDDAPAPTQEQVDLAVSRLCLETTLCRGEDGTDGADGANVTPAMVEVAVRAYCSNDGSCRGATGSTGPSGTDGADGADGADGQSVTQTQVNDAVANYCSVDDRCRGPEGPAGQNGSDGAPGMINFVDNCEAAPAGQVLADVNTSYNPDNQTATVSCTYKDDQSGILAN